MGRALGHSLAHALLSFHEQMRLNDCPEEFTPGYYERDINGILTLFHSVFFLEKFTIFLSSKLRNIKFNYEKESNNSLPFLDILIL